MYSTSCINYVCYNGLLTNPQHKFSIRYKYRQKFFTDNGDLPALIYLNRDFRLTDTGSK